MKDALWVCAALMYVILAAAAVALTIIGIWHWALSTWSLNDWVQELKLATALGATSVAGFTLLWGASQFDKWMNND